MDDLADRGVAISPIASCCDACCAALFALRRAGDSELLRGEEEPLLKGEDTSSQLLAFTVGGVLGSGSFAVVRLATHRESGRRCALKLIDKQRSNAEAVAREVGVLRRVGLHEHIVGLIDEFELERSWVLVLELVCGGEVFDRICARGAYSERDAAKVLRQVADALAHIHAAGVCHRDVKPENLLLVDDSAGASVKLCDFGLACELGAAQGAAPVAGTVAYCAPEMLRSEPHGSPVDAWALGVVGFILLCGRHPFDPQGRMDDAELAQRIKGGEALGEALAHPSWQQVSAAGRDAVRRLLAPRAAERPTAAQLLCTPWLQGAAPATPLPPATHTSLRAFNDARRLWKKARRAAVTSVALRLLRHPPPRPPAVHRHASQSSADSSHE